MSRVEEGYGIEYIVIVLIMILYTISSSLFHKYHLHFIAESGMCIVIGLLLSLIDYYFNASKALVSVIPFDSEIFFNLLLPPIIFSAGYNLNRKGFYKYFLYIISLGLIGTIVNFMFVAPVTMIFNSYNLFYISHISPTLQKQLNIVNINEVYNTPLHFSYTEILLFSAVITATDTVSALTFIPEKEQPKLSAVLFGEGVVNDAVCIVLYRVMLNLLSGKENEQFSLSMPIEIFNTFISLIIISMIAGAVLGLFLCILLKKLKQKQIYLSRAQETSIIMLYGYFVYAFTEEVKLSPIIALQTFGMFSAQFTFFNLSFQGREESSIVSRMVSFISEGFIFVYLGLSSISFLVESFSFTFVFYQIFILLACRTATVFFISWLMNKLFKGSFNLKYSDKGIMSFAGTIRGSIAFGLATTLELSNKLNKSLLLSSTLSLVIITTLVFGALMPNAIKFFKSFDQIEENQHDQHTDLHNNHEEHKIIEFTHPNFSQKQMNVLIDNPENKQKINRWISLVFGEFDYYFAKPTLIYDFPNSMIQHDELTENLLKNINN